ncbi:hypothetical protein D3C84_1293300 [compost metagenome]
MNHGVADFHTGTKTVDQDPSGLALQQRQQVRGLRVVAGVQVQGDGELTFEGMDDLLQLRQVFAAHDQ